MRVLQHGQPWSLQGRCNGCGAVLEVEPDDVRYHDTGLPGMFNPAVSYYYAQCPECPTQLVIAEPAIPGWVQERAQAQTPVREVVP
jgi:hypothetical protein